MDITKELSYLEQLEQEEQNAFINHDDMNAIEIYDSIVRLKKSIVTTFVSSYSSGYIGKVINNTKYSQIDKAINKTLLFLFHAEESALHDMKTDPESIAKLIQECYKRKDIYEQ